MSIGDLSLIQHGWDLLDSQPIFGFLLPSVGACAIVLVGSAIGRLRRSSLASGMFVSGMIGVVGLGVVNALTALVLLPIGWWFSAIVGAALVGVSLQLTGDFIKYRLPGFDRQVAVSWVKRGATFITALLLVTSFYLFSEGSRIPQDMSDGGPGTISIGFSKTVHLQYVQAEFHDTLAPYVDLNFSPDPSEQSGKLGPVFIEFWNSGLDGPFGSPPAGSNCAVSVDQVPSVCTVKPSSVTGGVIQEIRIDQPLGIMGVRVNIPGKWSSRGSKSLKFSLPTIDFGSFGWTEFQQLRPPRVDELRVDYSFNRRIEPYPLPPSGGATNVIRSDQRLESVTPQTVGPRVLSWTARNPNQTGAPSIPDPTAEIVDSAAEATIARETFVLGALIGTSSTIWSSLNTLGMKWATSFTAEGDEETVRSRRRRARPHWHHKRPFRVGKVRVHTERRKQLCRANLWPRRRREHHDGPWYEAVGTHWSRRRSSH